MFVRLFYSSISFMQIQIVGVAGLPEYAVVREQRCSLEFWQEGGDARHLEIECDFYRLVIFAWWTHPFPSRTRK
jgi:hypothetical protein